MSWDAKIFSPPVKKGSIFLFIKTSIITANFYVMMKNAVEDLSVM